MVIITSSAAERISDDILSTNDEILGISIMDMKGNILAAKSKESFKQAFGVSREEDKYGGSLAVAALAVANEVKDIAGEAQALITIYKNCKMMLLLPIPRMRYWLDLYFSPQLMLKIMILLTKLKQYWRVLLNHHRKHWYYLENKSQHSLSVS